MNVRQIEVAIALMLEFIAKEFGMKTTSVGTGKRQSKVSDHAFLEWKGEAIWQPQVLICFVTVVLIGASVPAQQSNDRFKRWDTNNDGKLSKDETSGKVGAQFDETDVNNDGSLSREEFDAHLKNRTRSRNPSTGTVRRTRRQDRGSDAALDTKDPHVSQKYHDQLPDDLKDKVVVKAKVHYGSNEFQFVNAFLLKSDKPTPVILTYHGGGWAKGIPTGSPMFRDNSIAIKCLRAGISWVDVGYSLTGAGYSKATPTKDPAHWPVQGQDAAMGVQLTRYFAKEWNVDPDRIAVTGVSAGGHLAMWVAFSDDQADPQSKDPVKRLSSRVSCVICMGAPVDFRWFDIPALVVSEDPTVPGKKGGLSQKDMAICVLGLLGCTAEEFDKTERSKRMIDDANLINKIDRNDPPALLVFRRMDPHVSTYPKNLKDPHSYWNGVALQRKFAEVGIHLDYNGGADRETQLAFLKAHLKMDVDK